MAEKTPNLQTIRGMDDVLPVKASSAVYESESWRALRDRYTAYVERFGYRYIETPVLEMTELFRRTSGETSDIVSKEMYTFETRGGESISMRPEGSASVCRAVMQHSLTNSGADLKFFYIAPMFRAERPQRGRYRQHTQLGLELFKETDATADAEVISILYDFFSEELGLKQLTVHINSVGTPECRPAYRDALVDYLNQYADKLSEDSRQRLNQNPMRILDSKAPEDQAIADAAPKMLDHLDEESAAHFEGVKQALAALNVPYSINTRLVRGLDYYTRTAFEITCESLDGAIRVIGGGGRYDALVEQIGGHPTPAVGFGSGIERVLLALESQDIQLTVNRPTKLMIAYIEEEAKLQALSLAQQLRREGLEVQFPYQTRNFSKQLKSASKSGTRFIVIVGGEEAKIGKVIVKDFEARKQETISPEEITSTIQQWVSQPIENSN
ncbi:MAG: histidine--tRNA ligase [Sumerlaeia bacterium]